MFKYMFLLVLCAVTTLSILSGCGDMPLSNMGHVLTKTSEGMNQGQKTGGTIRAEGVTTKTYIIYGKMITCVETNKVINCF